MSAAEGQFTTPTPTEVTENERASLDRVAFLIFMAAVEMAKHGTIPDGVSELEGPMLQALRENTVAVAARVLVESRSGVLPVRLEPLKLIVT